MSANINEIKKLLKGLSRKDLEELNSEITEQLSLGTEYSVVEDKFFNVLSTLIYLSKLLSLS